MGERMTPKQMAFTAAAVLIGGVVVVKVIKKGFTLINPFSDQNAAYQGAESLVKKITGNEKATVTDLFTRDTYNPDARADVNFTLKPPASAPYWFNADGTPRKTKMGAYGTVFSATGRRVQVDAVGNGRWVQ